MEFKIHATRTMIGTAERALLAQEIVAAHAQRMQVLRSALSEADKAVRDGAEQFILTFGGGYFACLVPDSAAVEVVASPELATRYLNPVSAAAIAAGILMNDGSPAVVIGLRAAIVAEMFALSDRIVSLER